MNRAYSLLTIKEIDEEQRTITGIASTPTVDMMGDTVDPMGAEFKTPMPLLLYHDTTKPVGQVTFAKPNKNGIPFKASLPNVKEPGIVQDRVNEAWHSIKYKLLAAVSIGFKPDHEKMERNKSGGYHFPNWKWLELTLCAIGANEDALIQGFKSFDFKSIDTELRAASGHTRMPVVRLDSSPAGVTAPNTTPEEGTTMDLAKQITAFEAKRLASFDRMAAIMEAAEKEGRTLDESQQEEYDGQKADVASIDKHLENLHDMEKLAMARAKPVVARSIADGSASREPVRAPEQRYITVETQLPKGIEFARYVKCFAAAHGNPMEAYELAKENYPDNPRIATLLKNHHRIKAAVAAGTTTDAVWAGPFVEYQTLANEFIDYLRPMTIVGKFGNNGVPALNSVPFNIRILMQTSGGDGYWVGEGAPKPLTSFEFDTMTMGFSKVANIAVLTDELVRFSNPSADAQIRKSLADALRARLDIDFIDPDKAEVSGVSPASITNGITAIPSSGTSLNDVRADLEAALGAFIADGIVPNVVIMSQASGLALSMMRNELGQPAFSGVNQNGGTFEGLSVITSQYVSQVGDTSGSLIIFLNTEEIFLADDGGFTIDASREASLQMDTAPTNNSATGTATQVVSMWQTNSMALKAERFINWKRRRDAGVQYLSGVNYTSVQGS